jgi:DNA repair protein RadC
MHYAPIYRLSLVSDGRLPYENALRQSNDVAKFVRPLFDGLDREQFVVVLLNAKHCPIGTHVVSIGSLTASVVHPRLCVATHKRGYVAATVMLSSA